MTSAPVKQTARNAETSGPGFEPRSCPHGPGAVTVPTLPGGDGGDGGGGGGSRTDRRRHNACARQGAWLFDHRLQSTSVSQAPRGSLRGPRRPPASPPAIQSFVGGARRKSRLRRAPWGAATAMLANEKRTVVDAGQWARAPGGACPGRGPERVVRAEEEPPPPPPSP